MGGTTPSGPGPPMPPYLRRERGRKHKPAVRRRRRSFIIETSRQQPARQQRAEVQSHHVARPVFQLASNAARERWTVMCV